MKFTLKKKAVPVQEEENTANAGGEQNANPNQAEITNLLNSIAQIEKQKADAKKTYDDKVNQCNQQIVQIRQKLADLGADAPDTSESAKSPILGVARVIKESYDYDGSKKQELGGILQDAFENVDLSYTFSLKECENYARYIIEKLNDNAKYWNKSEDNWAKLEEILKSYQKFINKYVKNNSASGEAEKLLAAIKKSLIANESSFSWIFGSK